MIEHLALPILLIQPITLVPRIKHGDVWLKVCQDIFFWGLTGNWRGFYIEFEPNKRARHY